MSDVVQKRNAGPRAWSLGLGEEGDALEIPPEALVQRAQEAGLHLSVGEAQELLPYFLDQLGHLRAARALPVNRDVEPDGVFLPAGAVGDD